MKESEHRNDDPSGALILKISGVMFINVAIMIPLIVTKVSGTDPSCKVFNHSMIAFSAVGKCAWKGCE